MTEVPFVDLRASIDARREELGRAMWSVIDRSAFVLGQELQEFERAFAAYCGVSQAVGVGSGTDALLLAYLAVGIKQGDEVIVPVNTFIATVEPLTHIGARPVFVDCLPQNASIDPDRVTESVTERTKAIVPVHLYGQPADMERLSKIATEHGLATIEDAAQAHGASLGARKVGSFGAAAAFSFYPSKNLGAFGDGGAVLSNDHAVAERVRLLRNHGDKSKSLHVEAGYCSRLDNLQAAVLQLKLGYLDADNSARRRAAEYYDRLLGGVGGVRRFEQPAGSSSVHHLYVVQVEDRDRVRERLEKAGIHTGIHYPAPLHLTPAYAHLGYGRGDFPIAEGLAERILSLPMFPEITTEQIEYVVEQLAKAVAR